MNWSGFLNAILGLWLISSPATFGYKSQAMAISDVVSGIVIIILGLASVRRPKLGWATVVVGLWLQLAPLVFWAPDAASYINNTLVGVLLLGFCLVLNGPPGVRSETGPEIPPGWSYNPSSYAQRIPILAMNFCCWFIARYLTAFQLGYIDHIWDPVFGDGTLKVLTSTVSKAFPVADAGLGAFAYTIEAIMGFGDPRRWHTQPWMVVLFGILVIPVSCISILLIILQPTIVGHWCFLCIVTAILMLIMIPFAVDEVAAVIQFLRRTVKEGKPFFKILWQGDNSLKGPPDPNALDLSFKAMTQGFNFPWNLVLTTFLGLAGMFLGDYIPSALIITFSVVAFAEVTRSFRFALIPFAIWLMVSIPIIGIAVMALAFRKGTIREKSGR